MSGPSDRAAPGPEGPVPADEPRARPARVWRRSLARGARSVERGLRDVSVASTRQWLAHRPRRVAPTGAVLGAALVLSVLLRVAHSPLSPLPGVAALLLVPGAAVLALIGARPVHSSARVVVAVCVSMTVLMAVGLVSSALLPLLGVARPLDSLPEYVIWAVVLLALLAASAHVDRDPVRWLVHRARVPSITGALVGAVLVAVSLLGAGQLNHSGDNAVATVGAVLDVVVLVGCVLGGWRRDRTTPLATLLYFSCLALLLSQSLRGAHLFGWDVQQEFGVAWNTVHAGVWGVPANHDPYASMLSLTVLPAVLHGVAGLHLEAFFEVVVPAVLALLPVAVFSTVRSVPRWITSGRTAPIPGLAMAVVVGLVVSSVAFSSVLVSVTRQAMATTMLATLVMVLLDRSVSTRAAQVVASILIVAMAFTHYTTSYLTAGILTCTWVVSTVWMRGWLGAPRAESREHTRTVRSRRLVNGTLVVVAIVSAAGWNLAITRNSALTVPAGAIAAKGVGIGGATSSVDLTPTAFQRILVSEYHQIAPYIVPYADARRVRLVAATLPSTHGSAPALQGTWKEVDFLAVEGLWLVLGVALLYGMFRLGQRRSYEYTSDLVGLGVTGLLMGALLRSSGTLASFYNPERAAIVTAILLAAPATLFLDDIATGRIHARPTNRRRSLAASRAVTAVYATLLVVGASGLSALVVGGQAPGSLSANDVNAADFTVTTAEYATAAWIRDHVTGPNIVQSDLYGHLVLMSQPGSYDLVPEILPREVAPGAYLYLSQLNLAGHVSQANADSGNYTTMYRTTTRFFARHFSVVYSTGSTRVYH